MISGEAIGASRTLFTLPQVCAPWHEVFPPSNYGSPSILSGTGWWKLKGNPQPKAAPNTTCQSLCSFPADTFNHHFLQLLCCQGTRGICWLWSDNREQEAETFPSSIKLAARSTAGHAAAMPLWNHHPSPTYVPASP